MTLWQNARITKTFTNSTSFTEIVKKLKYSCRNENNSNSMKLLSRKKLLIEKIAIKLLLPLLHPGVNLVDRLSEKILFSKVDLIDLLH